ncbi:MAG TPA: ROK family protein, partial [Streptosporangiaceae bacterium]|nr:ROK family protein [Streptosporangiaceae bacterium]
PILRERDVPLGAAISSRLDLPTLVESDSNAAAVAEHWFRRCRHLDDFLVVTIDHSLGLGVIHGGQLFRGAHGISFHLGDLVVGGCGRDTTRLADIASEAAILNTLLAEPDFAEAIRAGTGLTLALQQQDTAEGRLQDAVARAGDALGIAIGNLITLFAPALVVLTGSTLAFGARLMEPLRAALEVTLPPWLHGVATLVVDELDDTAWARGAAGVALRVLYGAPWGTTGPMTLNSPARTEAINA